MQKIRKLFLSHYIVYYTLLHSILTELIVYCAQVLCFQIFTVFNLVKINLVNQGEFIISFNDQEISLLCKIKMFVDSFMQI